MLVLSITNHVSFSLLLIPAGISPIKLSDDSTEKDFNSVIKPMAGGKTPSAS
jgi:hypothetical protein